MRERQLQASLERNCLFAKLEVRFAWDNGNRGTRIDDRPSNVQNNHDRYHYCVPRVHICSSQKRSLSQPVSINRRKIQRITSAPENSHVLCWLNAARIKGIPKIPIQSSS